MRFKLNRGASVCRNMGGERYGSFFTENRYNYDWETHNSQLRIEPHIW